MFPNVDPKALKAAMEKMGIKTSTIESTKVVIHCKDKDIVIDEPEVTMVQGQGMQNFQVSGRISEVDKSVIESSEDDVNFVKEQTGVEDDELIRKVLQETKGDMAQAILRLKEKRF